MPCVVCTHHIIHDGWSMGIVLSELAALYPALLAGRPSPLPELPVQFADFSAWQRNMLQGETLQKLRAYWRGQLAGRAAVGAAHAIRRGRRSAARAAPAAPAGSRRPPARPCWSSAAARA